MYRSLGAVSEELRKKKELLFKLGCPSCGKGKIGFSDEYNGGPSCRCLEKEDLQVVLSLGIVDYRLVTTDTA